jgi:hypothetical protein
MSRVVFLPVIGGSLDGAELPHADTDTPLVKRIGSAIEVYYVDEDYTGKSVRHVLRHYATLPIGGGRR